MLPKLNIYKYALKWAAIGGVVLIIHKIGLLILEKDKEHQVYLQHLLLFFTSTVIVSISAIYFYKKANNSSITIKQALQIGFFTTLITTIIITIYDVIFLTIIEPDYYKSYYELNWEAELKHHISRNPEEHTEETFKVFINERNINHFKLTLSILLLYGIILNLITSLITGLILRAKRNKIKN